MACWLADHPTPATSRQMTDWLRQVCWLIPVVVVHFFIFCNVVRLRRKWELLWAGLFLLNTGIWFLCGTWNWWGILGVQTPVTLLLLLCEIMSPRYHGIFSGKLNPHLHDCLLERADVFSQDVAKRPDSK